MNPVAQFVLIGAVPFVLLMFAMFPPRKALVISYVVNWLALPPGGFVLVGLPDYTKTTSTSYGAILAVLIFDFPRLTRFRPKWIDLPIVVYSLGQIATSYTNELPLYDGLTSMLDTLTMWGVPFFLGRLYLSDLEGCREMAQAVFAGGAALAPVCVLESRLSPFLQKTIYGSQYHYEGQRLGLGFRPLGFMNSGLELAMWMITATLVGFWLWKTGAMRPVMGIRQGRLIAFLAFATLLTKSFGAIALLLVGFAVLLAILRTKSPIPLFVLLAVPPLYMYPRAMDLWTGREVVEIAKYINEDRASSLEYRMDNEDILTRRAMRQPWFGWGGYNRFRMHDDGKTMAVPDGYWVIALGVNGLVGLTAMSLVFLLPGLTLLRKYPIRKWVDPEVAPAAVFAVCLGLIMIDNLSNAMFNPIYVVMSGAVLGIARPRALSRQEEAAERLGLGMALRGEGRAEEAEAVLAKSAEDLEGHVAAGRGVESADLHFLAETYDALAQSREGGGEEQVALLRRAAELRNLLATSQPENPDARRGLASEFEKLGRALWSEGRADEADEAWLAAIEVRRALVEASPESESLRREWADAHNDFAWLLARSPRPGYDDTARAADLAAQALGADPGSASYWNTLGVARFASGDFPGSVEALNHSVELSHGGNGYDHYVLAMAYHYLGYAEHAVGHFRVGEGWSATNQGNADLALLRSETLKVLSPEGVGPPA